MLFRSIAAPIVLSGKKLVGQVQERPLGPNNASDSTPCSVPAQILEVHEFEQPIFVMCRWGHYRVNCDVRGGGEENLPVLDHVDFHLLEDFLVIVR